MRRFIPFIVLALLVGGAAEAAVPSHLVDAGEYFYNPAMTIATVGEAVEWTNDGNLDHTATAARPFRVFGTGTIVPTGAKDATMGYAGTYAYRCVFHSQMRGTMKVKPEVLPENAATGDFVQIRFGTAPPPAGKGMDLQMRKDGGNWSFYRRGRRGTEAFLKAPAPGVYDFRVRMRRFRDDKHTAWSPPDDVSVV